MGRDFLGEARNPRNPGPNYDAYVTDIRMESKGKSRCELNVLCQQRVPKVTPMYSVEPGMNELATGHHTWIGTVLVGGKSFSSDCESSKAKARESAAIAELREMMGVLDVEVEEVDA